MGPQCSSHQTSSFTDSCGQPALTQRLGARGLYLGLAVALSMSVSPLEHELWDDKPKRC